MLTIPSELDILPPRPVLFPWLSEDFLDFGLNCCWGGGGLVDQDEIINAAVAATTTQTKFFSFDSDDYYDTDPGRSKERIALVKASSTTTPETHPLNPYELSSESSTPSSSSSTTTSTSSSTSSSVVLKPLFGDERAASHGTTTIMVLSREEHQDNDCVDGIPDMSPSDDTLSESGSSYQTTEDETVTSRSNSSNYNFWGTTNTNTNTNTKTSHRKTKLVTFVDVIAEVLRVMMFFLSATGSGQKALLFPKKRESQKVASGSQ